MERRSSEPSHQKAFLGTYGLRAIVSKKKKRFEGGGFNLDLSYISKCIIAMGFPSQGMEGVYRNKMADVYRLLETYHADRYWVYNLCSERSYDAAKFHGRVDYFPFDDHSPPPFELMRPFCNTAQEWLLQDPDNVIAVHCKAGQPRSRPDFLACRQRLPAGRRLCVRLCILHSSCKQKMAGAGLKRGAGGI